ncbi:C4-dicarboxylate TRAP transporter substrate-binding protein [Marivita geojedonensis]|uniref:C4-dicarboxylate ABC transporter substrate-binding protein n=1 Tax=Marivita geojedonensis TaxID=1123756 RepID=A0A1X4NPL8_9RHOB|nr:C4-dicarboxylate TRAP transporter substrate-binding protein [Marivita geojedonensis]OSQ52651.1 C4-dicarboxylate ABC transporter substrate-binding protein [Marivita geojedonensis]PRY80861.1 TRAP-type C4-dicarboxylate transport system substrate-binding protein [Marivita geojedonensis]
MKSLIKTTGLALAAVLAVTAAHARDIRIAPAAPPAHPANGTMYTNFAAYLPQESGGSLTATILGPEVVNLLQMKDALQSQVAEVGNLLPLYFPADLPMMSVTGQLSLTSKSPHAMGAAMTEFIVNCAPCQDEMKNLGFVYLGSGASDLYEFITTKPVKTAADLQGLRLRSGGAPWARLAENFGAVPVQMSVFDQFEAMNSGTIDGTMASVGDLLAFRLVEVAKHITKVPIGGYISTSNFTVSNVTWASLSQDDKDAMVRAANRANADFTNRWGYEIPDIAEAAANEAGIEFIEADPALVSEIASFVEADIETAGTYSQEQFGISDAPAQIQEFLGLVSKWEAIAAEVNDDPKAMAERVYQEVWSKVDTSTYGS